MAIQSKSVTSFTSGVHNLVTDELIPEDAASDSIGWLTQDGRIELMYGRQAQGAEGATGEVLNEHTGYKTDGTSVRFRKVSDGTNGEIQYLNSGTWTTVQGSLSTQPVTFSNYSSVSGNYVYVTGPEDGIYKIVTANPADAVDVYLASKNFKGYSFIDKARMIMWSTADDKTGLYGSYIDSQDGDVYTTVSAESIGSSGSTNYTGTLGFKSGGSRRTCFAVTFTDGTQTITIDFTGSATSDSDGTGTVNFATGVYNVTFSSTTTGPVTSDYQWEDSTLNGVTDFTKSATRVAGEGFVVRQDKQGDAIKVVIPFDGSYFSFKETSVYQFTLDAEDTNPSNQLIRADIGAKTADAAVSTGSGIVFMDTGNPTRPILQILQRNPFGDNFQTQPLFAQFKFQDYNYDDVVLETWDQFLVVSCRYNSNENNRLLMCNMREQTVDVAPYGGSAFTKDGGFLYMGDPNAQTSYEMFTGFDDMGLTIRNEWTSRGEKYGTSVLKRTKNYRFRGLISPAQSVRVELSLDNGDYFHIGTILGSGDYVDYSSTYAIGTSFIGAHNIGGGEEETVYHFLLQLKVRLGKFRKRQLRFKAENYGYVALQEVVDFDIWKYGDRIPKHYRQKQNVDLEGNTNQPTP